ncbi:MAG TPA: hypothetical protein VFY94_13795 [Rhodanobacteraceae bacterium]|nr:hypothetical protein [Rhodanobacteraceae bacterium]
MPSVVTLASFPLTGGFPACGASEWTTMRIAARMTWQRVVGLRFRSHACGTGFDNVAIMGKGISGQSQEKPMVLMPFADMEAGGPLLAFAPHQ